MTTASVFSGNFILINCPYMYVKVNKKTNYICLSSSPDCPACYSLVQERVNIHRGKLRDLHHHIITIGTDPDNFNNTEFMRRMNEVNDSVVLLLDEARGTKGKNISHAF